ncbi:hypothetical protein P9112_011781 [Eukaryota sp. TZLM1-RC]
MPPNDLRKQVLQNRIQNLQVSSDQQDEGQELEQRRQAIRTRLTNLLARSDASQRARNNCTERLPPITQQHSYTTTSNVPTKRVDLQHSRRARTAPTTEQPVTYDERVSRRRQARQRPTKSAHDKPREEERHVYRHKDYNYNHQESNEEYQPQPQAKPTPPPPREPSRPRPRSRHADQTIESVCGVLNQVIVENQKHLKARRRPPPLKIPTDTVRPFDQENTPRTPTCKDLYRFLYTFAYRTRMSHEPAVAMLAYIDRLIERTGLVLSSKNWKKILFSAVVVSQKYCDDESFFNSDYNKLYPELSLQEVNALERSFLALVDFDLSISPELYNKYQKHLQVLNNNELDLLAASPYPESSPSFTMPLLTQNVGNSRLVFSEVGSPKRM